MPVHGEGDIVGRDSLYLPCTMYVPNLPCAMQRDERGPGVSSVCLPSASPPRARADLISLTHGSLRACSNGVPLGLPGGESSRATGRLDGSTGSATTGLLLTSSGVTGVSQADPADKRCCAHGGRQPGFSLVMGAQKQGEEEFRRARRGGLCHPVPV